MKYIFFLLLLPCQLIAQDVNSKDTTEYVRAHDGYVGFGLGIPYGVLGVNMEYNINNYLYLSGGAGMAFDYGLAYNGGLVAYFSHPDKKWRPRISAFYGINSAGSYFSSETYPGITLGAGTIVFFGKRRKNGLHFETHYIASSKFFEVENFEDYEVYKILGLSRLKFSLAFRYKF